MKHLIQPLLARFRGRLPKKAQTLVEYALVLSVMSVIFIVAFSILNARLLQLFSAMNDLLDTAQNSH